MHRKLTLLFQHHFSDIYRCYVQYDYFLPKTIDIRFPKCYSGKKNGKPTNMISEPVKMGGVEINKKEKDKQSLNLPFCREKERNWMIERSWERKYAASPTWCVFHFLPFFQKNTRRVRLFKPEKDIFVEESVNLNQRRESSTFWVCFEFDAVI